MAKFKPPKAPGPAIIAVKQPKAKTAAKAPKAPPVTRGRLKKPPKAKGPKLQQEIPIPVPGQSPFGKGKF